MIKIIAHRGYRSRYPENTIPSIKAAIELEGIAGVEFDVDLDINGKTVVVHQETMIPDKSFARLVSAERNFESRNWVANNRQEDIIKLDAGSWFDKSFSSLRVPTLGSVLNLDWKDKTAYVELIDFSFWSGVDSDNPSKLIKAIKGLVTEYNIKIEFISFNPKVLLQFKECFPNFPCVLNFWPQGCGTIDKAIENALNIGVETLNLPDKFLLKKPELAKKVKKASLKLFVFEVSPAKGEKEYQNWKAKNRLESWRKLIDLGVDGIITDFPVDLQKMIS